MSKRMDKPDKKSEKKKSARIGVPPASGGGGTPFDRAKPKPKK